MQRGLSAVQLLGLALILSPLACTQDGRDGPNLALAETTGDGEGEGEAEAEGDGDPGDGDPGDGDGDCTPGDLGCICANDACAEGLACVDGLCQLDDGAGCPVGSAGCPCNEGACDGDLECVDDTCSYPASPHANCGWDAENGWNVCGSAVMNPEVPLACDAGLMLESGTPCPDGLSVIGCCDDFGNNWWCETGTTAFENCGGPGDGDGDPGDGDGDPGDGDGDPGDGDGDPGDGDGDPGDGDGDG